MSAIQITAIVVVIGIIILAAFKIFTAPMKLLFKLLVNTLLGFISLIIINFLGSFTGLSLGINWVNAAVVGVFGVPGVGLLLLLQWLMMT